MNSASSEDTTHSEPIPRPKTATEDRQQNNSSFHNALSRHLSQLAIHARHKEGIDGDTEESTKKKGRMLLGKKMFGS